MILIELGNLLRWYCDFLLIAKGKDQERHECAEASQGSHPPDVPNQREAGDNSKERGDEAGPAVLRHFDRLVLARLCRLSSGCRRELFPGPEGVSSRDVWKHGVVPG